MSKFKEFLKDMASRQRLIGKDFEGWLGNGLQELQMAAHPNIDQIGMGTNATLGTVTSGEVTAERRELEHNEPEME